MIWNDFCDFFPRTDVVVDRTHVPATLDFTDMTPTKSKKQIKTTWYGDLYYVTQYLVEQDMIISKVIFVIRCFYLCCFIYHLCDWTRVQMFFIFLLPLENLFFFLLFFFCIFLNRFHVGCFIVYHFEHVVFNFIASYNRVFSSLVLFVIVLIVPRPFEISIVLHFI